jgi:hypothetical protein
MNFVGLTTKSRSVLEAGGWWWEAIAPERIEPRDLHAAQVERRRAAGAAH